MGVGLLNELGEGDEKALFVQVPYCVFKLAGNIDRGFRGT